MIDAKKVNGALSDAGTRARSGPDYPRWLEAPCWICPETGWCSRGGTALTWRNSAGMSQAAPLLASSTFCLHSCSRYCATAFRILSEGWQPPEKKQKTCNCCQHRHRLPLRCESPPNCESSVLAAQDTHWMAALSAKTGLPIRLSADSVRDGSDLQDVRSCRADT